MKKVTTEISCDICGKPMTNNLGSELRLKTTMSLPQWSDIVIQPDDMCADCGKAIYEKIHELKS